MTFEWILGRFWDDFGKNFGSISIAGCRTYFDKIDFPTTYANVVASSKLEGGKIPIPMKDGDQAVRLALKTLNGIDPMNARVVRIKNTLKLAEIYVSESMLKDVDANSMLEAITSPADMSFNSSQF